jgi:hypothetical protein
MSHPFEGCINSISWQYWCMFEYPHVWPLCFLVWKFQLYCTYVFVFLWHIPHPTAIWSREWLTFQRKGQSEGVATCSWHDSLKSWTCTRLHNIPSQKIVLFIVTAVRISDPGRICRIWGSHIGDDMGCDPTKSEVLHRSWGMCCLHLRVSKNMYLCLVAV